MPEPPACLFYWGDYLIDTAHLTNEEKGIYIDLLGHAWVNRGIPTDHKVLARMARCGTKKWAAVWEVLKDKWDEVDGKYVNKRQEEERRKQAEYRAKKAKAGAAGGKAKAKRRSSTATDSPQAGGVAKRSLSSSTSSSEEESKDDTLSGREEIDPAFAAEIERLWDFWPHRRRDLSAPMIHDRLVDLGVTDVAGAKQVLAAAIEDAFSVDWAENVIPKISKWLRERQWDRPLQGEAPPLLAATVEPIDSVDQFRAAVVARLGEDVWDIWISHCWFGYRDDDHALVIGGTARQIGWLELRYGRVLSSVASELDYSGAELIVAAKPKQQPPEQAAA